MARPARSNHRREFMQETKKQPLYGYGSEDGLYEVDFVEVFAGKLVAIHDDIPEGGNDAGTDRASEG